MSMAAKIEVVGTTRKGALKGKITRTIKVRALDEVEREVEKLKAQLKVGHGGIYAMTISNKEVVLRRKDVARCGFAEAQIGRWWR